MMRHLLATMLVLASTTVIAAEPRKADESEKSADAGDKMICKRFSEIGSLVNSRRICKTKRDWERERDALRQVNSGGSCGNAASPSC